MAIVFDNIKVGEEYDRPKLAEIWGYAGWQALGRGIVTPSNEKTIVLFVTKTNQAALAQYQNDFDGERLFMEGEENHANDRRLVGSSTTGDAIHLFYRELPYTPFKYHGVVALERYDLLDDQPSKFVFATAEAIAAEAHRTEDLARSNDELYHAEIEGARRLRLRIEYDRSDRNRAEAIRIHGTYCKCCGFNFNEVYGSELARDYIEVHHVKSITTSEGVVEPSTDLVPLCSNCHSMVHRRHGEILTVDELKIAMQRQKEM